MRVEFKAKLDILSITMGCTTNREIFKLIQALMGLFGFVTVFRATVQRWRSKPGLINRMLFKSTAYSDILLHGNFNWTLNLRSGFIDQKYEEREEVYSVLWPHSCTVAAISRGTWRHAACQTQVTTIKSNVCSPCRRTLWLYRISLNVF